MIAIDHVLDICFDNGRYRLEVSQGDDSFRFVSDRNVIDWQGEWEDAFISSWKPLFIGIDLPAKVTSCQIWDSELQYACGFTIELAPKINADDVQSLDMIYFLCGDSIEHTSKELFESVMLRENASGSRLTFPA